MGWIRDVRAWWLSRPWDVKRPHIAIVDDAIVVTARGKQVLCIPQHTIATVEMFKRDMLTVDDVCCQVYVGSEPDVVSWTLDEDMPGFYDMMAWFEAMPGFLKDWQLYVIQPPFAENRTLVLDNKPKVYRSGGRRKRS